ncbi:MAG: hypothetical protein Kow0092_31810 [Deferrisomatales bacterium]
MAGMLRPSHLLDLIRNFTVFQQVDGKTRKVAARYQRFRAVHKAVERLETGRTRSQGADRDERGGIIWHTRGGGVLEEPCPPGAPDQSCGTRSGRSGSLPAGQRTGSGPTAVALAKENHEALTKP